jgi:hypothetical protein
MLPPDARTAFARVAARGTPLAAVGFGRGTLGVKCGCNEAFVVELDEDQGEQALVSSGCRRATVERELLRPLVRGDGLTPWTVQPSRHAIVWTHAGDGRPLAALPTGAARWLAPWRRKLCARTDLRGARAWWMLFRTDGALGDTARVVWSDFGRRPRAAFLPAGDRTVPLNTCYVVRCAAEVDALALTALINSPLAAAWLNAIAEPARGGWRRYHAWTMSMLPLPRDWHGARDVLAPLALRALAGAAPGDPELLEAACRAYRVRPADVAPLVAWYD